MEECLSLLKLHELAIMETLLPPTRGLLLVLNGVTGVLPPLIGNPSPLPWVLPTVGEGVTAVHQVASSLRLTEGARGEPYGGEEVLLVPGAVAADEDDDDNLKATTSWRACAIQQKQAVTTLRLQVF